MALSERPRASDQELVHVDQSVGGPLPVEPLDHLREASPVEPTLPPLPCERRTRFDIGHPCRRYRGGELDLAHNRRAPRLLDVQLHQGARVQIKDQPRSSLTMSETRRPLRFGLTARAAPTRPATSPSGGPRPVRSASMRSLPPPRALSPRARSWAKAGSPT